MGRRPVVVTMLALALVGFSAGGAVAAAGPAKTCDTSWKAAVDGAWGDASNWTNGVPDSPTSACITKNGTYTVLVAGNGRFTGARSLTLGAAKGSQTLLIAGDCNGPGGVIIGESAYPDEFGSIGAHATVRLTDTGCDASAFLEEDRGTLTNSGTITIDSTSANAPRMLEAAIANQGTLRFGAGTHTTVNIGIVDAPSAVTEIHLGATGGPTFIDPEPGIGLDGTLAIVTDLGFVATAGYMFNLCTNCSGRFATVTGQTLPHHFFVRQHYRIFPDGYPSLDLKVRKTS